MKFAVLILNLAKKANRNITPREKADIQPYNDTSIGQMKRKYDWENGRSPVQRLKNYEHF